MTEQIPPGTAEKLLAVPWAFDVPLFEIEQPPPDEPPDDGDDDTPD